MDLLVKQSRPFLDVCLKYRQFFSTNQKCCVLLNLIYQIYHRYRYSECFFFFENRFLKWDASLHLNRLREWLKKSRLQVALKDQTTKWKTRPPVKRGAPVKGRRKRGSRKNGLRHLHRPWQKKQLYLTSLCCILLLKLFLCAKEVWNWFTVDTLYEDCDTRTVCYLEIILLYWVSILHWEVSFSLILLILHAKVSD